MDSPPEGRAALKRILIDFGTSAIDTAGSIKEAIDFCNPHQYDIVLPLTSHGKSGQQLMEELRFNKLLKNSAVFIIASAENTSPPVLQALAYQPDNYVSKPINSDSPRPRLDYVMLCNESLALVKNALDIRKKPTGLLKNQSPPQPPHPPPQPPVPPPLPPLCEFSHFITL